MSNNNTITSANAVFLITESNTFPAGVQLQGFAADAAFATETAETAETKLGVDGILSAGWVPRAYKQNVSLQADSDSILVFDAIAGAQDIAQDVFWLTGVITFPAVGKSYTLTRGVLTNYKVMPDAKKLLEPQEFSIIWNKVQPAII